MNTTLTLAAEKAQKLGSKTVTLLRIMKISPKMFAEALMDTEAIEDFRAELAAEFIRTEVARQKAEKKEKQEAKGKK